MAQVVTLVDDLFFQAKLLETAKQLGIDLRNCSTTDAFLAEATTHTPKLLIVDLNGRDNPIEAISRAQASHAGIPLIGFFSHVQTELAERASAAGCPVVMPRSKFTRDLATILGQAKSE